MAMSPAMLNGLLDQHIVDWVWRNKYRYAEPDGSSAEDTPNASLRRVVDGVYRRDAAEHRAEALNEVLARRWSPGGRHHASMGVGTQSTALNCFVLPTIQDSMRTQEGDGLGIMDSLTLAALTQQMGGGIGMDFSTIRPLGSLVSKRNAQASGPLAFMDMWDGMCKTIMAAGSRRGAMMACLRCDHPDIEAFIEAKHDPRRLRNFNVSITVSDEFMRAVEDDGSWPLHFTVPPYGRVVETFSDKFGMHYVYKTVRARDLWQKIMLSTYDHAEPGIMFIDTANRMNNLWYRETLAASNPCGEQIIGPGHNCNLGAVNLAVMVDEPFTARARIDFDAIAKTTRVGMRWLDNVIDESLYPTEAQEKIGKEVRRTGLGITGLGNMLMELGLRYGSPKAVDVTHQVMQMIRDQAYMASIELAKERGAFPAYDRRSYSEGQFIRNLPTDIRNDIHEHGIRNSVLLTIAPTGTTSLYYGNVSSGLEPVFSLSYKRKTLRADGGDEWHDVEDFGYRLWKKVNGYSDDSVIKMGGVPYMATAQELSVDDHLQMQVACQIYVDNACSKTINVPTDYPFEDFVKCYEKAYAEGLKGCTTYRYNPESGRGAVLMTEEQAKPAAKPTDALQPRPAMLVGKTYKLRWPASDHAFYVTINDDDGKPFEIFINSKNVQHQEWIAALTRTMSAVFRRGGDVTFLVSELEQVHSANAVGYLLDGKYHPSLVAMIGHTLRTHLGIDSGAGGKADIPAGLPPCPACHAPALQHQEGCSVCLSCGHSDCG